MEQTKPASPLRAWRGDRSLEEVARLLDTTTVTVWRWETGASWPERSNLERVMRVTGLTADQLLRRETAA
jgi:hypothetical protein